MISYMKHPKSFSLVIIFLLLTVVLYIYICVRSPSISNPLLSCQESILRPSIFNVRKFQVNDEFGLVLEEASMANKTLIITIVNKAYVEQSVNAETTMLDLFLESFWLGEDTRPLLDHLLFVTVDQTAYERCKFKRLHCYRLMTDGVDFSRENVYMSPKYVKMVWRKTLLLLDVLKRGYSFIFTDTDILWLRNPFAKLSRDQTVDLQISLDSSSDDPARPEDNLVNTGFFFIRSNNKTISLVDTWYSQKDINPTGKHDQHVMRDLMHSGLFNQLGLQVRFLDTRHFSGFCEDSHDVAAVTTMHANCCRFMKAKFSELTKVLREWKQFKATVTEHPEVAGDITRGFKWSTHTECENSWKQRY
ncbi:uncharacterized protein At1g28695-like [Durio zibethinus]|uniref:Uncharacterized protein At1g28695-like n=1 Tax=Durio zibethinus TaxID=66656 RepID=A0A6P5Y4V9_DURZI|nr:uncharacterized protein At1g28695-like [Durio zibethinus]